VPVGDTEVRPRQVTGRVLERLLDSNGPDVVLVRVTVLGTKHGGRRRLEYEIIDHYDAANGITAMMRCTAYPASIILQMLGAKQIEPRGVIVQERCVPAEAFIAELAKRDIQVDERQS
jgi:lysine 6-dehydrogenase